MMKKNNRYKLGVGVVLRVLFLWGIRSKVLGRMIGELMKRCEVNRFEGCFRERA